MLAKLLAVVGGVDDPRVLGLAGRFECPQDLADVVVQKGHHPVVGGDGLPHGRLVDRLVQGLHPALPGLERVL